MLIRSVRTIAILWILVDFTAAQDVNAASNRFIDVRKLIRDTLDVIRSYQAPEILAQPVLDSVARQQTQQQQQQQYYSPQQQYQQQKPYRRIVGQEVPSNQFYQHQQQKTYSTNVVEQPTNVPAGGPRMPALAPLTRLLAAPTRADVERLLHLPADIVNRMAEDAGYVPPSPPAGHANVYSYAEPDDDAYGGYYQLSQAPASSVSKSSSFGSSGFDFNIQGVDSNQKAESTTTTVSKRMIYASGKPHVFMHSFYRDGKVIQVPVLSILQADGHTVFIPYERLELISAATAEIVANGRMAIDPFTKVYDSVGALAGYYAKGSTVSPFAERTTTISAKPLFTTLAPPEMVIGESRNTADAYGADTSRGDALATNRLPAETFRKMFHVTDQVYPGSYSDSIVVAEGRRSAAGDIVLASGPVAAIGLPSDDPMKNTATPQFSKKLADKRDRKRVIATESHAFLQEVDEEPSESTGAISVTSPSVDSTSVGDKINDDNVIVLNGRRYRLVADGKSGSEKEPGNTDRFGSPQKSSQSGSKSLASVENARSQSAPSFISSGNFDSFGVADLSSNIDESSVRPQLKSAPINAPASDRPLARTGLDQAGRLEYFHVTQQTEMPSLPNKTQPFSSNPIQASYGQLVADLLKKSGNVDILKITQQQQQTYPYQQQLPQHGREQQYQPQQNEFFPTPTAFVQEAITTIRPVTLQPQSQAQEHHIDGRGSLRPVQLHHTSGEQVFVVNGGTVASAAETPALNSAIRRVTSSGELRRKQQNRSDKKTGINERPVGRIRSTLPYARHHSIKKLEEFYRPQHAAARLSSAAVEVSPERPLRAGNVRSIESDGRPAVQSAEQRGNLSDSALKKLTRLEALRRQFAYERQRLTQRHKIHATANTDATAENVN